MLNCDPYHNQYNFNRGNNYGHGLLYKETKHTVMWFRGHFINHYQVNVSGGLCYRCVRVACGYCGVHRKQEFYSGHLRP